MNECYYFTVEGTPQPVIADLWYWPPEVLMTDQGGWVIHRINVPSSVRGQGHGRRMLQMILDDADREGVTLLLSPEASGGLSQEDLISWYTRHGFTFTRSGAMMERPPNP